MKWVKGSFFTLFVLVGLSMLPQLQGMPLANQLSQIATSTLGHIHELAKPVIESIRRLVS